MKRPCLEPRCPELVERGPRCPTHTGEAERQINRAGKSVYATKRWQVLRRRKLRLNSLCETCGSIAQHVHHKHGVVADPWSLEGLESLCASCHGKQTRREQREAA